MTSMETFKKGIDQVGLELSQEEIEKFKSYKELLKDWNERIDITTIVEDDEVDIKHFLDSLSILESGVISEGMKVIDVGTGGGFPGLPLKIVRDDLEVLLLDSLNKRIGFLDKVVEELGLDKIWALHGRAEELSRQKEYREQFDLGTSRAVANLRTLSEYVLPFVKPGGYFISMKGPEVEDEVEEAKNAIELLGGQLEAIKYVKIPESDIVHSLVIIKKVRNTKDKYPRGGGKPRKKPL